MLHEKCVNKHLLEGRLEMYHVQCYLARELSLQKHVTLTDHKLVHEWCGCKLFLTMPGAVTMHTSENGRCEQL